MIQRISATLALLLMAITPVTASDADSLAARKLDSIGAAISLPAGWKLTEEVDDGVVVVRNEGDSPAFSITMTPDIPGRAGMKPSEYAAELLAFATDEGGQITKLHDSAFLKLRVTYSFDSDGDRVSVTDMVAANDKTGTLYFLAWQVAESKARQYEPLRDAILASLQLDPAK